MWLLDRGWHTELALDVRAIDGPLGVFAPVFPGARALLFGFGKRHFMTAAANDPLRWLTGPFPGVGLIQVIGWRARPDDAPGRPAIGLTLTLPARRALADFIWSTVARDAAGAPLLVGAQGAGVFYASPRRYTLGYTCNAWTAEALAASGLAVSPAGVVWVADVMRQVAVLPAVCGVIG